jgi:carboxyl-terminal processing protease
LKKFKYNKLVLKIIFALGVLFLAFYSGYGYGSKYGRIKNAPSDIINADGSQESIDFGLFWQTWNKARELYIGKSDSKEMFYGAVSGMVASLGDPYTVFLRPQDNEDLASDLSGKFDGIGAELTDENGQIVVISPLSGSPAEQAGIKPKDIILEIDGQSTEKMAIDTAVRKIRGKAGTEVKLKIRHVNQQDAIEIKVVRASIKVDSVSYKLETISGKKIAVLKVSQFGDDTMALANKYVGEMKSAGAEGIIIDLRNNPGGYLDTSVSFSNLFLKKGAVVLKEVDKNGQITEYKANNETSVPNLPIVILVNNGSASAAEIVAGAMKDNHRAEIIGEKTFGKGSVQQLEPLTGGAALKVTIAKWLTPAGSEINQVGLSPDVTIGLTEQDKSQRTDAQLEKAKSEIVSKLK